MVRSRAANPQWIAGMMRHGFRGAAEIAATLEHMAAFAHLADAVPSHLFDLYYDATLGNDDIRAFLARENPAALSAIENCFAAPARGVALGDAAQFHRGLVAGGVMNGFEIKGWCPSALRPMLSGDGLVVRLRPRGGRLSSAQAVGYRRALASTTATA